MAKTRNGVKKSKSRHQPYSKRTTTTTTDYVETSNTEPDPEYIPSSSTRKKALNFNLSDNDSEPVSKNLRSRTLEQRNRSRNSEHGGGFNNFEHDVQNAVNLDQILLSPQPTSSSSPNQVVVHQYSVRANSPPSPELLPSSSSFPSTSSSPSVPPFSSSNQNSSVPIPNSTSDNLNNNSTSSTSTSSGRRSKRKRKHNRNNSNNNNTSSSSSTVPESSENHSTTVSQLNNVPNNISQPSSIHHVQNINNNNNSQAVSSETLQIQPQNLTTNTNNILTEQTSNNHQVASSFDASLENIPIDNDQNLEEDGSGGSLSPYQRVTRNLYRSGHVGQMYDPDIELDVFEEYARIRMGTMNMTVSMIENQTVVFRFDSNPGLNFWSNSDTHPPIQPVNPQSFPDLLPLPRLVEHKIKDLATSCENGKIFNINDLNRIFNELQDISDSHPVALIMISILEALDKIPPSGQLEDIAYVIPDIQRALERLDNLKNVNNRDTNNCENNNNNNNIDSEEDSGSIVDFDGNGKPIIPDESKNDEEEGDNCSICLSGLVTQFPLAQLKVCKHVFHAECLKSWHTVKYTCPLCRSHLSPIKVKLEYRMHSI